MSKKSDILSLDIISTKIEHGKSHFIRNSNAYKNIVPTGCLLGLFNVDTLGLLPIIAVCSV